MSEKKPPIEERLNKEDLVEETVETTPKTSVSIETAEDKKSLVDDKMQELKPLYTNEEVESFTPDKGKVVDINEELSKKYKTSNSWWAKARKAAGILSFVGVMFGAKEAKAGSAENALAKKSSPEKTFTVNPGDSLDKIVRKPVTEITPDRERKTIGRVTIEGRYLVPYHDKSVEVCVVYVSGDEEDKNKAGEIITAMQKDGGWEAASGKMLQQVADENKNFSSKMEWVMSLSPESEGDDSRSQEGQLVIDKEGGVPKTKKALPQHNVFPTRTKYGANRFESKDGLTYSGDGYGYIFYRKLSSSQDESSIASIK